MGTPELTVGTANGEMEPVRTPDGHAVVRVVTTGETDDAKTRALLAGLVEGGAMFGKPVIFVTGSSVQMRPAVRDQLKEFSKGLHQNRAPIAVVCSNGLLRLAIKAMCVLAPHGGPVKVVQSEPEALVWMDSVLKA